MAEVAATAATSGVLRKGVDPAELLDATRIVASGEALLSPRATSGLLARSPPRAAPPDDRIRTVRPPHRTRARAHDAVATGLRNDDITERLHLSPLTVKTHVNRAMMKLGVRDRAQLVVLAYEGGPIQPARNPDPGCMGGNVACRKGSVPERLSNGEQ